MNWFRELFGLRTRYTPPAAVESQPTAERRSPDPAPALIDVPPVLPTEAKTAAPTPPNASADDLLHRPLLEKLATFKRHSLRSGQILFHSCYASSEYTDVSARRLGGPRKWVSEDASYACDYGGAFNRKPGDTGHLWVCRIRQEVPALVGLQSSLIAHSPWGQDFPWQFPNTFELYANAVLDAVGPVALFNNREEGKSEILNTSPERALEVVEVLTLPDDAEEARALGCTLNEKYAALPSLQVRTIAHIRPLRLALR